MLRIQDQLPYIILIVLGEGSEGEYKLVFCACLYEYSYFTFYRKIYYHVLFHESS